MSLFDAIVTVDWSANSTPKVGKDSIWIGVVRRDGDQIELGEPINPATRFEAENEVAELLTGLAAENVRTLVGFDFSYGYPRGLAAALGLPTDDAPWSAIWRQLSSRVQDGAANTNNRFAVASELNSVMGVGPGPFWGCPTQHETSFLRATRRGQWDFPYSLPTSEQLKRLRETERRMKGVQETWKLFGVGSVGSQALLGIPCLARLSDRSAGRRSARAGKHLPGAEFKPAPIAAGAW